jgi:hypothetical protein
MPVTEHAQRRAARADALVTAQLAFALNGYSFDGLAERVIARPLTVRLCYVKQVRHYSDIAC